MDALTCREFKGIVFDTVTLLDLWQRRASLTGAEIGRLYLLVRHALQSYYPAELRALCEDKDELIAQFMYSRVLRLDAALNPSHSSVTSAPSCTYALCAYFRRYLIDCMRSASYLRNVSIEVDGVSAEVETYARSIEDPVESVLSEHGLNEAGARQAARAFVNALDEPDRLILAGSLGSSGCRKGGLKGVADENHVRSYHYRARKLGVTMKKSAKPADFASTKIGRWLTGILGVAITDENRPVILVLLNLLALEANP